MQWNKMKGFRVGALAGVAAMVVTVAGPAASANGTAAAIVDVGWPREFKNERGQLVVYQPQIDSWESYRKLQAEIRSLEIRQDKRLQSEERKRWRQFSRSMRKAQY